MKPGRAGISERPVSKGKAMATPLDGEFPRSGFCRRARFLALQQKEDRCTSESIPQSVETRSRENSFAMEAEEILL
jgi:hypothetical protein